MSKRAEALNRLFAVRREMTEEEAEPVRRANPSAERTPPPSEPAQQANPPAPQTRPQLEPVPAPNPSVQTEPVPVANPTGSPQQTGLPPEPVRVTDGFTIITNHLLDDVLPTLEPHEQVILLRIYRLTRGHSASRCKVSRKKLGAKTRVKRTRLLEALAVLEERGYIKRLPDDVSSGDVYDRGMNLEILLPGREPVRDANPSARRTGSAREPNKDNALKKDSKSTYRLAPDEAQAKASEVTERLRAGEGIDEIAAELAPNLHPVDWATVRSLALASVKSKPTPGS